MIKWYALCAKYHDDEISVVEMGGACVVQVIEQNCVQGFGRKPEGKKPLGRFEHNIETPGRSSMGRCRLDSSGSG